LVENLSYGKNIAVSKQRKWPGLGKPLISGGNLLSYDDAYDKEVGWELIFGVRDWGFGRRERQIATRL